MELLAQIDIGNLFKDMNWSQIALLVFVGYLFLTGKLKFSDILNILNPRPTPTPNPIPTPDPNVPVIPVPTPNTPVIDTITKLLPILLPILLKAKATNNKALEDATTTLIKEAIPTPPNGH